MCDRGFIVHSFTHGKKPYLYLIGRLENGQTFGIIETRERPLIYIRETDYSPTLLIKGVTPASPHQPFKTMDNAPVITLECEHPAAHRRQNEALLQKGIRTYEGDIPFIQQYRIRHGIHGSISIQGDFKTGDKVDRIYMDPGVTESDFFPDPVICSIDIETGMDGEIRAISLVGTNPYNKVELNRVLLVGDQVDRDFITCFSGEKMLLAQFAGEISSFDPDIITGWNVIDFDFSVIARRFTHHALPMTFGRSSRLCEFLPATEQQKNKIIIPGRQVIDTMWLVRFSPDRYADYKLETVARTLLDEGKDIALQGTKKVEALDTLYEKDPGAFAAYCLQDAHLVLKILKKTGLMALTIKRALLTGVDLEYSWTSIRPFENLYMEKLYRKGIIAPTRGVDAQQIRGSEGGLILAPESELFENIFVFDFKSLYPSIIRTFNIDPASLVMQDTEKRGDKKYIFAPNGACFSRIRGILPGIVDHFFSGREEAKQRGDQIASYVYKILMNSFYGVLGTPGCRFASDLLAGAITGFGRSLLTWCRELLGRHGFRVIYGDTDSLFVQTRKTNSPSFLHLMEEGRDLVNLINRELSHHINTHYNVESKLELEFEKIYAQLFIPPIRSGREDRAKGRTKGYAGFILTDKKEMSPAELLEIKGMEAIRSDWTVLAQQFQTTLFILIFTHASMKEISGYITQTKHNLFNGKYDHLLMYTKTIRRSLDSYTKTRPPQVKAAEKLGWTHQRGKITYYMTTNGPEPAGKRTSPMDYQHYLDKQLKPIAFSLEKILTLDLESLFRDDSQPWLF